jgi:thiol-disulfide isomerase/thioredoxin
MFSSIKDSDMPRFKFNEAGGKTTLIIVTALIAFCVLVVVYDAGLGPRSRPLRAPAGGPAPGVDTNPWAPVPKVSFVDLEGGAFTLDEFKGKVVLLNFWASWCPPCAVEFPSLLRLIRRYDGDVALVAVSNDEDKEAIGKFLKDFEGEFAAELKSPSLRVAWDRDRGLSGNTFNTVQFPETIIVSPDGRMARKVVGDIRWDSDEIRSFMDALLAASPR